MSTTKDKEIAALSLVREFAMLGNVGTREVGTINRLIAKARDIVNAGTLAHAVTFPAVSVNAGDAVEVRLSKLPNPDEFPTVGSVRFPAYRLTFNRDPATYCDMCGADAGKPHHDPDAAGVVVVLVDAENIEGKAAMLCQLCKAGVDEIKADGYDDYGWNGTVVAVLEDGEVRAIRVSAADDEFHAMAKASKDLAEDAVIVGAFEGPGKFCATSDETPARVASAADMLELLTAYDEEETVVVGDDGEAEAADLDLREQQEDEDNA